MSGGGPSWLVLCCFEPHLLKGLSDATCCRGATCGSGGRGRHIVIKQQHWLELRR
jgi:hypothetical protein